MKSYIIVVLLGHNLRSRHILNIVRMPCSFGCTGTLQNIEQKYIIFRASNVFVNAELNSGPRQLSTL